MGDTGYKIVAGLVSAPILFVLMYVGSILGSRFILVALGLLPGNAPPPVWLAAICLAIAILITVVATRRIVRNATTGRVIVSGLHLILTSYIILTVAIVLLGGMVLWLVAFLLLSLPILGLLYIIFGNLDAVPFWPFAIIMGFVGVVVAVIGIAIIVEQAKFELRQ